MKMKKGGTGVFIENENLKENFIEFIEHSDIEYLSRGTYGIIVKAVIPPGSAYISKYKSIDYSRFGDPVASLIIKIVASGYQPSTSKAMLNKLILPVSNEDFSREVNIQTDIFLKTMHTLQPLCPAIVYSNSYTNTETEIIDAIHARLIHATEKELVAYIRQHMTGYSIVGMELMEGYQTVNSLLYPSPQTQQESQTNAVYQTMAAFILIELAIKTGYTHADFHYGNILINPTDNTYFKGVTGSVILIDFGMAFKIPLDTLSKIRELYETKYYHILIKHLCFIPRIDGLRINHYTKSHYFICNYTFDSAYLDYLFVMKQEATHDIIQFFNSKTDQRDRYPMLPLSNSIKKKMFPGMEVHTDEPTLLTIEMQQSQFGGPLSKVFRFVVAACHNLLITPASKQILLSTDITNAQYIINSCYMTAYLIGKFEFISVKSCHLAGIVAMYWAGLDERFSDPNNLYIYSMYEDYLFKANIHDYTEDIIEMKCKEYKNKFKNVRIITIYDYMTKSEIDNITSNINAFQMTMSSNAMLYNQPEQWVKGMFRATQTTHSLIYQFPYQDAELSAENHGGRRRGSRRKNRGKRSKKRPYRHKKLRSLQSSTSKKR